MLLCEVLSPTFYHYVKQYPYSELFWSVFSHIRTEYEPE